MEIILPKIPETINDIRIIELTDKKVVLEIDNVTVPYTKTLGDTLLKRIETMAIDKIEVRKNTSVLPLELIFDRLSFVPIKVNSRDLSNNVKKFDYYDGIHTRKNTILFDLKKNGPSLNEIIIDKNLMNVLSGDMKWIPFEDYEGIKFSQDNSVSSQRDEFSIKVSDDNYVLLKLLSGQEIDVLCYALKGTGEYHAKFSPISNLSIKKTGEIGKIEGTNLNMLAIDYEKPDIMTDIYMSNYITSRVDSGDVTVSEYSLLYPKHTFRVEFELVGQLTGEEVIQQALDETRKYMNLPYSERMVELLPGYLY